MNIELEAEKKNYTKATVYLTQCDACSLYYKVQIPAAP